MKKKIISAMICVTLLIKTEAVSKLGSSENQLWQEFKTKFNKTYNAFEEENSHRKIFFKNFDVIKSHNEENSTFNLGINQFADTALEDIIETLKTESMEVPFNPLDHSIDAEAPYPSSFDWRSRGAVTNVKDQKSCGACYALSAVSALEIHIFIKTGNFPELSAQEILECGSDYQSIGCGGGFAFRAFDYVRDNGGLSLESDYQFVGNSSNSICKSEDYKKFAINVLGFATVPHDEDEMRRTIFQKGPIVAMISTSHHEFLLYKSGIFLQRSCNETESNHAVLLVGYGEENGISFWIAKNSYGETWGESGYIKIATKRDGHCGIDSDLVYPVLNAT